MYSRVIIPLFLLSNIVNANINKVSSAQDLSITIYNNNIAMVNDSREINIKNNKKQKLIYEGIASSVIHESIILFRCCNWLQSFLLFFHVLIIISVVF